MITWETRSDKASKGSFKDAWEYDCQAVRFANYLMFGLVNHEMALTREQAGELGKVLTKFAETGEPCELTNVQG